MNCKTGGILAYHGYQSFQPGEVTPEQAHQIGVELARRMWGDRFEVVVSTHLDHDHIHNHFVINSVSCIDGKKYECKPWTYKELRRVSDEICRENGLSIIEKPGGKKKHYAAYKAQKEGRMNYLDIIKKDLDEAIWKSGSINEFFTEMKSRGYKCITNKNKYFLLIPAGKEKPIRIDRENRLGRDYSLEAIEKRILETGKHQPEKRIYRCRYRKPGVGVVHGLHAYYIRYAFMMGLYQRKRPGRNVITPSCRRKYYPIREELLKMNQISAEVRFLGGQNIFHRKIADTDDLEGFLKDIDVQLHYLYSEQQRLRNRIRRADESEADCMKERLDQVNGDIKYLKKEKFYACDIRDRTEIRCKNMADAEQTQARQKSKERMDV
jgi:hypothetical protein